MTEHRLVLAADEELRYRLQRSPRRKTIGLKIDQHGLTVVLPWRVPESEAERVLREKADWIRAHLQQWQSSRPEPLADGATIFWLGEPRQIRIVPGRSHLTDTELCLALGKQDLPQALQRYLQHAARQHFPDCVDYWSEQMKLRPQRMQLSSARGRWGSCTAAGVVRLSWRLMQVPPSVLDYVIIHELAHLAELNHSERFWAVVSRYCADWKVQRNWLKQNGATLLSW